MTHEELVLTKILKQKFFFSPNPAFSIVILFCVTILWVGMSFAWNDLIQHANYIALAVTSS